MTDLAKTIAPKSDQLNADDMIAGPMTITITKVRGCDEPDQPIAVHFEGDNNKPYKPCKSMRRVMVHCWGPDGNTYAGRRMTIYRDDNVMFGGIKVGGIRISHMSHIDREVVIALTATRAKRTPYTVKPLRAEVKPGPQASRGGGSRGNDGAGDEADGFPGDRDHGHGQSRPENPPSELSLSQRADAYEARIKGAPSSIKLKAIRAAADQLMKALEAADPERGVELEQFWQERFDATVERERAGE